MQVGPGHVDSSDSPPIKRPGREQQHVRAGWGRLLGYPSDHVRISGRASPRPPAARLPARFHLLGNARQAVGNGLTVNQSGCALSPSLISGADTRWAMILLLTELGQGFDDHG